MFEISKIFRTFAVHFPKQSNMITTLRSIPEIFPTFYTGVSDEETLRRVVDGYMDACYTPEDLYQWIERQGDPYRREACAVLTIARIRERSTDEDDDFRLNPQLYEETILPALKRIIRYAQSDQYAEEMLYEEGVKQEEQTNEYTRPASRVDRLEEQMAYALNEIKRLKDKPAANYCTYIVPSDIKSAQEIEADLRSAAEKDAPTLAGYLERALTLGYLNFGRDSKKIIFSTLDERYHMGYSYDNFKRYFRY